MKPTKSKENKTTTTEYGNLEGLTATTEFQEPQQNSSLVFFCLTYLVTAG